MAEATVWSPYLYGRLQLCTLLAASGVVVTMTSGMLPVTSGPLNPPFFIPLNPAHAFVCSPYVGLFLIAQFMQAISF